MDGVVTDDELHAHARERTLEVVGGCGCILGADIDRVRVEFGEDERYRLIYQGVDVDSIDILVVNEVKQVVETVASAIDNVESVSRKVIREKRTEEDTHHDADCHDDGHESV